MADAWYYSQNGGSIGPVPRAKLAALLSSGAISGATLVWTAGMTGWEPASSALGAPPPLPPAGSDPWAARPPSGAVARPQTGFAAPYLTFGQAIAACFDKYAVFRGRASRSEYWWWYLFNILVSVALAFVFGFVAAASQSPAAMAGGSVLSGIWSLVVLLPNIAVQVRRLHDTGRSGWWIGGMFLAVLPLIAISAAATDSSGMAMLMALGWLAWFGVAIAIFVFTLLPGHPERNAYQAD